MRKFKLQVVTRLRQQAPEKGFALVRFLQRILFIGLNLSLHDRFGILVGVEQRYLTELFVLSTNIIFVIL